MSRVPGLADQLVDDAAVFPPGNAPIDQALRDHAGWVGTRYEPLVGPLLVPASAVDTMRSAADPDDFIRLGLIADTGLEGLVAARDALQDDTWFQIVQLELAIRNREDPAGTAKQILAELPFTAPTYLEIPLGVDPEPVLDVLAADGVERAKFRCGNDDVPTVEQLAAFLFGCARRQVAFKLTAGLHHALPTTEPSSGLRQHGFLNALVATSVALSGGSQIDVANILTSTDGDALVESLVGADVPALRGLFRSFGSCSVTDPYADLVDLSLQPAEGGDR